MLGFLKNDKGIKHYFYILIYDDPPVDGKSAINIRKTLENFLYVGEGGKYRVKTHFKKTVGRSLCQPDDCYFDSELTESILTIWNCEGTVTSVKCGVGSKEEGVDMEHAILECLELFDIKNTKKGQSPRVRTWPLRKIFTFGMLGISEILKKYASNTDCIKHSLKRSEIRI